MLDVFIVTEHMHSILPSLSGPVAHVAGAITLVVALDFGLRWTLHRKTCNERQNKQFGQAENWNDTSSVNN